MNRDTIIKELENLSLDDVQRHFEIARQRVRQREEGELPHKPPGDDEDSGSGAPTSPKAS